MNSMLSQPTQPDEPAFRLLVCGGRYFADEVFLRAQMNAAIGQRRNVVVIHGDAPGADRLADKIAREAGVPIVRFRAGWSLGRRAGPIRNQRMIDEGRPDLVLAMPGGDGTADMVRRALAAGIPTIQAVP